MDSNGNPAGFNPSNPNGCTNNNWVLIDGQTPNAARLLAVIMTAQSSGQQVRYSIERCDGGKWPIVNAISVLP